MRIGIVTATYQPSRNGVATSTALFARGLRHRGHDVRIFAPRHPLGSADEPGVYRLNSSFLGARALGAPADYPMLLAPGPVLTSRLPLKDLDVLHTMHPFLAGQLASHWSRLTGAPLVYTAHTQYEEYLHYTPIPIRLGRAMVRPHVAAFARRADAVLAPGQAMIQMLQNYGFNGPIQLMPNPVDLNSFASSQVKQSQTSNFRQTYGLTPNDPVLIYLGRLAPEKNLDVLLQAFTLAKQDLPALKLIIVGGGPSQAELEKRHCKDVLFTGPLPYEQVPQALLASDAFITASTSEVLPMSMIEALAASNPLIAAHSPAALDLIQEGQNGTICPATPSALAQGIIQVMHPNQLPILKKGAKISARQYDLSVRAAALEEVYLNVLEHQKAM